MALYVKSWERIMLVCMTVVAVVESWRRWKLEKAARNVRKSYEELKKVEKLHNIITDKYPYWLGITAVVPLSRCEKHAKCDFAVADKSELPDGSPCECHFDVMHVHANKIGCMHYGVNSEAELKGKTALVDYQRRPEDIDSFARSLMKARFQDRPIEFEMDMQIFLDEHNNWSGKYVPGAHPSMRHIAMMANYIGIDEDEHMQFLYVTSDKTDEYHRLKTLRASEEHIRLILDTTDDGIYEVCPRTRELKVLAPRVLDQLGYTPEEFTELAGTLEKFYDGFLHPEDRSLTLEANKALVTGLVDRLTKEYRVRCKNGDYKWVISRARGVKKDESGIPTVIVGSLTMNHERKSAELALVEKNKQLDAALQQAAAAAQSKADFLANISHELRTPLNGIIGLGSILWETALNPDQRDLLKSIRDCSEGLLLIVNDVLDFSKIDANKMDLENNPFDLFGCIDNAIYLLNLRASAKGIGLYKKVMDGTPRFVWGDGNRLRQILMNVIGNAVKFTDTGEVVVTLTPNPSPTRPKTHTFIHFSIRDTGIGIPTDRLHLLFKPFSQIDNSTTRKYGGTGLGLAISQSLVQMMDPVHGVLNVESIEGQGSTFWFMLEMKVCNRREIDGIIKLMKHGEGKEAKLKDCDGHLLGERYPMMILMAEDNAVNQKLCNRMLQRLGYKSDIANNGVEAVEACQRQIYDLILMDMQMPIMSGLEATRHIREDRTIKQPIIYALTANARDADRDACLSAGMNGHISKPFKAETLIEMLEVAGKEVFARREKERERMGNGVVDGDVDWVVDGDVDGG